MNKYDVHLRPMPVGYSYAGTAYTVSVGTCNLSMLQDLDLQRTVAKGVLKKLHMQAVPTQHHAGKEIPREQWPICVAT